MRGWALALLFAACGDDSRADQCAQLYANRDDFRTACLQCGPIPQQGMGCFELCPNAPPQQWCQLTGGAETCCQCRPDSGWVITVLDCQLQQRDAAIDAEEPDGGPRDAPLD